MLLSFVLFSVLLFFFFNDTPTTEIYTLSLHDALPILSESEQSHGRTRCRLRQPEPVRRPEPRPRQAVRLRRDRKSTRLNSSHLGISYAVFCLKKKKKKK